MRQHFQAWEWACSALVVLASINGAFAQSTCDSVDVTGGISPGTYTYEGSTSGGKKSYIQPGSDGADYVLFFLDGSSDSSTRRRLMEAGRRGAPAPKEVGTSWADGDLVPEKLRQATLWGALGGAAEHMLASCDNDFWVNLLDDGTGTIYYPYYFTADCADHPADITGDWIEVTCEDDCVSSTTVGISCSTSTDTTTDSADDDAIGGSTGNTDADTSDDDDEFALSPLAIVGIIVAVVALLSLVIFGVFCWCRRTRETLTPQKATGQRQGNGTRPPLQVSYSQQHPQGAHPQRPLPAAYSAHPGAHPGQPRPPYPASAPHNAPPAYRDVQMAPQARQNPPPYNPAPFQPS